MEDPDYLMALELQRQFDAESAGIISDTDTEVEIDHISRASSNKWSHKIKDDLNSTKNIVHPEWESLDPTPDVFALFSAFDERFFNGKLKCVTLEWSKRMYSCAGICYSRKNRLGMAITIRLSEPLLKLRTRKDLIETLLHEMIHAYLSVLGIKEPNGGHGTNFKKIMTTINKVAGTNITVYHTFHDEVEMYKTHWWRCNGICQNRKPFYGFVRRTTNRAPGPNDFWWRKHLESCGGSFLKVREPEQKVKRNNKDSNNKKNIQNIRKFFENSNTRIKNTTDSAEITVQSSEISSLNNEVNVKRKKFGNVNAVHSLKDLIDDEKTDNSVDRPQVPEAESVGHCAGGSTSKTSQGNVCEKVRKVWCEKFNNSSIVDIKPSVDIDLEYGDNKRQKLNSSEFITNNPTIENEWKMIDDDIMLKEETITTINISDDEDLDNNDNIFDDPKNRSWGAKMSPEERTRKIKAEISESRENSDDEIEILDDDYNDELVSSVSAIADTSLIDDLFGEDTLIKEFKRQNALLIVGSNFTSNRNNDIITCPVCNENIPRSLSSEHLDGCTGITIKIEAFPSTSKSKTALPPLKSFHSAYKKTVNNIVPKLTEQDPTSPDSSDGDDYDELDRRRGLMDTSLRSCPSCAKYINLNEINEHLDICLSK